jgi:DNA-binding CsgD family transcriptional regulator
VAAGSGTWWLVRPEPQTGLVPDGIFDVAGLTGREREMMRLLVNGRSNPELARDLAITVNTVENHLRSIYAKLEVTSRGQAVARLLGSAPSLGMSSLTPDSLAGS